MDLAHLHRAELPIAGDRNRRRLVHGAAVAELAVEIHAPAIEATIGRHAARVCAAQAQLHELQAAEDRGGLYAIMGVGERTVAELAVVILPPAIGPIVGGHTAAVPPAPAHLQERQRRCRGNSGVRGRERGFRGRFDVAAAHQYGEQRGRREHEKTSDSHGYFLSRRSAWPPRHLPGGCGCAVEAIVILSSGSQEGMALGRAGRWN